MAGDSQVMSWFERAGIAPANDTLGDEVDKRSRQRRTNVDVQHVAAAHRRRRERLHHHLPRGRGGK
eukprot:6204768-Pleurochrysis_carterae.AAC.1